jgi:hypothetical protein
VISRAHPGRGCPRVAGQVKRSVREALAYERSLFDDLPPGLEAPRCFAHAERGGQYQVWLEDLGSDAMRWPARRL